VENKIDMTAGTRIAIPVILDLVSRTVVWADLSLTRHPNYNNNVEGNKRGIVTMGKAMCSLRKPNLHDLFTLHAMARGELVGSPGEADAVFSMDQGVTPFAAEEIMAEYLA